MFFKNFVYILVLTLFFGCSYKHDNKYISTKKVTQQSVANTKKSEIIKNGKIKLFITVTFLDNLKGISDDRFEEFVVSLHFPNFDNKGLNKDEILNNISFLINGKAPIYSAQLKKDDKLLKVIPASNPWNSYFLVKSYKTDSNFVYFTIKIFGYKDMKFKFEKAY